MESSVVFKIAYLTRTRGTTFTARRTIRMRFKAIETQALLTGAFESIVNLNLSFAQFAEK